MDLNRDEELFFSNCCAPSGSVSHGTPDVRKSLGPRFTFFLLFQCGYDYVKTRWLTQDDI